MSTVVICHRMILSNVRDLYHAERERARDNQMIYVA
jgi:hypothetical protein